MEGNNQQIQKNLTVKEVQDILRVSQVTAYSLIHSGRFPVVKIGRHYRIPQTSFMKWLQVNSAARW